MTQGFFVTTDDRWSAKNRAEDPHTNGDFNPEGVPPRLVAEEIAPDDLEEVLLRDRFDHTVEQETADPKGDTGRSDAAYPRVDEILADSLRDEIKARRDRRHEESLVGNMVLKLARLSSQAQGSMITTLEKQLNGEPVELDLERAMLRRRAFELAPHNAEIIGEPSGRGHS